MSVVNGCLLAVPIFASWHLHSPEEISFIYRISQHETVDQSGSVHPHAKTNPTTIEFCHLHNQEEISLSPRNC